jgi:hypothetical protein
MKAFETTGQIDQQQKLVLDQPIPLMDSSRVRVIVLCEPDENEAKTDAFDADIDQLADALDASLASPRPILSDLAVSRVGIYQDHP